MLSGAVHFETSGRMQSGKEETEPSATQHLRAETSGANEKEV